MIDASRSASSPAAFCRVVEEWTPRFMNADGFEAVFAMLDAVRIERVRQGHIFLSEADLPALRGALEA